MDPQDHNVMTITILDTSLSLVHIPRSRLAELTRPILKQLLRKSPKFLNLTANEIELSIFAEDDELVDFEPIARRDRQRQRFREASSNALALGVRRGRQSRSCHASEAVEMSFEKWRVLQIDSHDDGPSNSGSRVRELSAPLAAAGISILYQSSYLSDFIFVKASRLPEVIRILGDEGFTLYNTDPCEESPSPLHPRPFDVGSFQNEASASPGATSPAVFSRTRTPSVATFVVFSNAVSRSDSPMDEQSKSAARRTQTPMSSSTTSASRILKKSLSPAAAPVEVLPPDLACVGLDKGAADVWRVKIITLVGYPELIPTPSLESAGTLSRRSRYDERRNSLTDSLYGSAPIVSRTPGLPSPAAGPLSSSVVFSHDLEDSDAEEDSDGRGSIPIASFCPSSPGSTSDGDEYFSSSSPYDRTRAASNSTPSLVSTTSRSSVRSLPNRLPEFRRCECPQLSKISTAQDFRTSNELRQSRSRTETGSKYQRMGALHVPFFSFTRTAEGSSLTTDIRVLSALFDPDERHMLICPESLLDAGGDLNARTSVGKQHDLSGRRQRFDLHDEGLLDQEEEPAPGTMKCLQIDLQRFGLDKFGLVNRFSRVLEENGINHMYSSTYKTANLLVDKAHAGRAQTLLRSC